VANVMRLRKGTERAIRAPINQGIACSVGDMMYEDTDGSAKPAGLFTWTTDLATTQAAFKSKFLGVSRDQRLGTEALAGSILVDCSGCFEMPCAALGAQQEIGALIGPAKAAGNALLPQQVDVAVLAGAIGKLADRALAGATVMQVEMVSAKVFSGVPA
jgi:hypothetical protein